MVGSGRPLAEQFNLMPSSFMNSTFDGGSSRKDGPSSYKQLNPGEKTKRKSAGLHISYLYNGILALGIILFNHDDDADDNDGPNQEAHK